MFVVYSPEGQSFAANAQQLPLIKVDPSTRVNQVTDSVLKELDVDSRLSSKSKSQKKLSAYQKNQQEPPRHLVVQVAQIMSQPVRTIEFDSVLSEVYQCLEQQQIDYLPVVNNDALIGMVNRFSVLKRLLVDELGGIEQGGSQPLSLVMQHQVVTTAMHTDIRQVAQVFSDYDVGAIVVTDDKERLSGIVTQGDLVKRLAKTPPLEIYV